MIYEDIHGVDDCTKAIMAMIRASQVAGMEVVVKTLEILERKGFFKE